jgi:hypothetical protein
MPIGSISDAASVGSGVSLFSERRLSSRRAFSISLDHVSFGGQVLDVKAEFDDGTVLSTDLGTEYTFALNAMLCYLFRLESNDEGPYALLGAGLDCWVPISDHRIGSIYNYSFNGGRKNAGTVPLCLGVGFNYGRHIGFEAKYFFLIGMKSEVFGERHSPPPEFRAYSAAVHYVQCGIHCRF